MTAHPLEHRRLFSAQTLALVEWNGQDDNAVERLSSAMVQSLKRELSLLAQVAERGRLDGLWAAIHMMRTQGDTLDMSAFSPATQHAVTRAVATYRPAVADDAEARALAADIARALREILQAFERPADAAN